MFCLMNPSSVVYFKCYTRSVIRPTSLWSNIRRRRSTFSWTSSFSPSHCSSPHVVRADNMSSCSLPNYHRPGADVAVALATAPPLFCHRLASDIWAKTDSLAPLGWRFNLLKFRRVWWHSVIKCRPQLYIATCKNVNKKLISLTNGATHWRQYSGVDCPRNTPLLNVCCLADFGRATSNRVGVGKGPPKFGGTLGPPLAMGTWLIQRQRDEVWDAGAKPQGVWGRESPAGSRDTAR